jgi:hypothetical protein
MENSSLIQGTYGFLLRYIRAVFGYYSLALESLLTVRGLNKEIRGALPV